MRMSRIRTWILFSLLCVVFCDVSGEAAVGALPVSLSEVDHWWESFGAQFDPAALRALLKDSSGKISAIRLLDIAFKKYQDRKQTYMI